MFETHRDRVAIVTGGARGMGRSHVLGLARAGFHVAAVDVDSDAVMALVAESDHAGLEVAALVADVTDEAAVCDVVERVLERFGRVDVLVNNAGGSIVRRSLEGTSLEDWEATLRLNLTSQFLCIRAVLPHMRAQGGGRIINVASASVFNGATVALYDGAGEANLVAYLAAKAGVVGLTRGLGREVGRWNIAVNAVAPGFTLTERAVRFFPRDAAERVAASQAFRRVQQPDDATGAVMFLASPASAFITGQVIRVDGGWTMG